MTTDLPVVPALAHRSAWRSLLRNPAGVTSLAVIMLVVAAVIARPWIVPYDPLAIDLSAVLQPPSAAHLLGTDESGRDILSRILLGGEVSLTGALLVLVVSLLLGGVLGTVAGYLGGRLDEISTWFAGLVLALPSMIVLLGVRAIAGPSLWQSMALFGVLLAPLFFHLTRSTARAVRVELFVDAAAVSGVGRTRILVSHVLPSLRSVVLVQGSLVAGIAISMQAALDFLGLGSGSQVTWGGMLSAAFSKVYTAPQLMVWPALMIGLMSGAFVVLGNALRDATAVGPRAGRGRAGRARRPQPQTASPPDDGAILRVEGLTVAYPAARGLRPVLEGVDLTVPAGSVTGIVGESGSGKTQTVFAALGVLAADAVVRSGSIWFRGQDLLADPALVRRVRGRAISYVPQEPMSNLDPMFTIGHQLTEPLVSVLGMSRADARGRALALLTEVGIVDPEAVLGRYPHELSGGMAQRVLIAGAIACDPELLIADEPTTALDVTVQADILDLLRRLGAERGMTIVLVTHDLGVVADICDHVVVMRGGAVVEAAPVAQLFSRPAHPYTQELLRAAREGHRPARIRDRDREPQPRPQSPLLEVEGLSVSFAPRRRFPARAAAATLALDGVSLDVLPGETVGLVGESGSGKTTLGRAVLGLVTPTGGSIRFAGEEIASAKGSRTDAAAQDMQVVFQDPYSSLDPLARVESILTEPLRAAGVPAAEARERAVELLGRVALPADALRRYPHEFSGGQRQRIAIARALAPRPRLVVLDEPVSALDLTTQVRVGTLLRDLQEEYGLAYLMISHDLEAVRQLCTRVVVLYRGRVVEAGPAEQVITHPAEEYTRRLVAASPIPDPQAQAARRASRAGRAPTAA